MYNINVDSAQASRHLYLCFLVMTFLVITLSASCFPWAGDCDLKNVSIHNVFGYEGEKEEEEKITLFMKEICHRSIKSN